MTTYAIATPPAPVPTVASTAVNKATALDTAQEFEAFFIARMFDMMSAGIQTDGPFGGGQGEAAFRSMLNDEYARTVARAGGIGVADSVYREIHKLQEDNSL